MFLRKFHQKLEKKGVADKAIGHISVKKEIRQAFSGNNNIQLRFTRNETPLGVIIIKNKIINLIWGKRPTAIEITSDQIYGQYQNFFLEQWKVS